MFPNSKCHMDDKNILKLLCWNSGSVLLFKLRIAAAQIESRMLDYGVSFEINFVNLEVRTYNCFVPCPMFLL